MENYDTRVLTTSETRGNVLILTPMKNAQGNLKRYFELLGKLEYPKEKLSLGILVSDSDDYTFEMVTLYADVFLRYNLARVSVIKYDYNFHLPRGKRHAYDLQGIRRSIMARARNRLLQATLLDENWVFWLDSDLAYYPPTILQDLISMRQEIISANCLQTDKYGVNNTYDRNNWVETEESRKFIRNLRDDDLTFEGYTEMNTGRKYLGDMYEPSGNLFEMVKLDGIGGTSLLVSANLHRDGLIFPVTPIDHAIETEGLCKLAKKMGVTSYGLPNYVVLHE
ncbi:hypothetical protein MP638_001045 [Amoeboaphelidium occidentale]|nr:hypothetical protein MP638_001045 [Amoeboaphelidium occidentale]